MSELLDAYVDELPERCRTCPVLTGFVAVAESYELFAGRSSEYLLAMADTDPFNIPEANVLVRQIGASLLGTATDGELRTTRNIARLAEAGPDCPTPRRGAPDGATIGWKLSAWLRNNQICRNPNLNKLG